jgi:hypothetical protein
VARGWRDEHVTFSQMPFNGFAAWKTGHVKPQESLAGSNTHPGPHPNAAVAENTRSGHGVRSSHTFVTAFNS